MQTQQRTPLTVAERRALLSLHLHFVAQYKFFVIIIIIIVNHSGHLLPIEMSPYVGGGLPQHDEGPHKHEQHSKLAAGRQRVSLDASEPNRVRQP